ncbi:MAG: L-histidine N(alpha)-methyltransferase [Rhodopseudomonas palustris]|uniref:L-histidine N(Alpha)-methyltransferase n=1 Tax=Rhodopseudomonas palustris TaxID=1076 RepID=A0A933RTS0_RHOPL|nr:L-histidine N(alpha)-methyltransferase [Rhodopseudomonas palustris]
MNMHVAVQARAHQLDPQTQTFAADVLDGLSQPQKSLSPKYFYDDAGSELFVEITKLPEYYPTRTELGILRDRAAEIAALIPANAAIVEFGAGATTKIRMLLAAHRVAAYVPVDISGDFITAQAAGLRRDFPELAVYPVAADFTEPFALPDAVRDLPKVGFFPGSTLGNFEPHDAAHFLGSARAILGRGARLIIGVDLEKDERLLVPAYDDAAGVTAKFNLNVLRRINRELGGDVELPAFAHRALYNRDQHRIEMHLVSLRDQTVRILGERIAFRAGETIHTENSYKYSLDRFRALAQQSGWTLQQSWMDADGLFSVHALEVAG